MRKTVFIFIALLSSLALHAHPHTYIFTSCELDFSEGEVKGLWVQFEFDRFFSGEVIWGYDQDQDGAFDRAETEELKKYIFSNFAEFNYFTFIRRGDERILPDRAEDFTAWPEGREILFFRFYIPLDSFPHRDFHIALYDSTFFCACRLNQEHPEIAATEDFFTASGTGVPEISVRVEKNEDYPVYYNPQGSRTDFTTYDSWKPGLQTFIPEEIHVSF